MNCVFIVLMPIGYFHDYTQCVISTVLAGQINTAHDDKKVLKKEKNIFILGSVIFVRPVARQKSGNYKLRIIVKVAYCSCY